jgi:hypothetical protein
LLGWVGSGDAHLPPLLLLESLLLVFLVVDFIVRVGELFKVDIFLLL